jgi:hypothetical protein
MGIVVEAAVAATLKAFVVLALLILIVGLIKPKWIFFWMKAPDRILVSIVALLLFMGSFTGLSMVTGVHPQKPKPKSEKERTLDEINDLNAGPSGLSNR